MSKKMMPTIVEAILLNWLEKKEENISENCLGEINEVRDFLGKPKLKAIFVCVEEGTDDVFIPSIPKFNLKKKIEEMKNE